MSNPNPLSDVSNPNPHEGREQRYLAIKGLVKEWSWSPVIGSEVIGRKGAVVASAAVTYFLLYNHVNNHKISILKVIKKVKYHSIQ